MIDTRKTLYAVVDKDNPHIILGCPEGDFISESRRGARADIETWKVQNAKIAKVKIEVMNNDVEDDLMQKLINNEVQDALEWIQLNPNESCFASNYFDDSYHIEEFLETLLNFSCVVTVQVENIYGEDWRIKKEDGPYADTLIITTKPKSNLTELVEFIMSYRPDEYSRDGDTIRLWWD